MTLSPGTSDRAGHPLSVIVTGARGRVASHLADTLATAGMNVARVSRSSGEGCLSYDEMRQRNLIAKANAIVHCAWSCLPSTAELRPDAAQSDDLPLLRRLLDLAAERPDPAGLHFVFLSSGGAVYGECVEPATETTPLAPVGWYGRGKAAAESLLDDLAPSAPAPAICILRPSNLYGFRHVREKPQGIVGAALSAVRTGQPLELLGAGASLKDFLHISDFESAIAQCLRLRLAGTFNVCSGSSVKTIDVIEKLEKLGGFIIPRRDRPHVPWDVHRSMLSGAKLSGATGWKPLLDLEAGLGKSLREAGFNEEA